MEEQDNQKDPWKKFLETSKILRDFEDEEEIIARFSKGVTIDRNMVQIVNNIRLMSYDLVQNLMPEVLVDDHMAMGDMMYWIRAIAASLIQKLIGMGITISPNIVNNVYIYATFIYISSGGGFDALGETKENSD